MNDEAKAWLFQLVGAPDEDPVWGVVVDWCWDRGEPLAEFLRHPGTGHTASRARLNGEWTVREDRERSGEWCTWECPVADWTQIGGLEERPESTTDQDMGDLCDASECRGGA